MIKISISKKENLIDEILVKGHALYDESGKDIVCSAVSSIIITTINALIKIDDTVIDYEDKSGYIKIKVLKHSDITDLLLDNMLDLLEELTSQYKKYVKIN